MTSLVADKPKVMRSLQELVTNRVALSQASLQFFCRDVLNIDFEPHHKDWQQIVKTDKFVLVECSRDHGKTWFFSFAYPLWRGIFDRLDICLISYSYDQSMKLTEHIKRELENNEFFIQTLPKNYRDTWTKTELVLANGTSIRSESFGSSIRGGHYDFIIVDDPLKDYGGMNREDQRNFFYGVVLPALKPDGQIIVVGTPIDFNDLLANIEKNQIFKSYFFPAIKDDGSLLWEKRYNRAKLDERRKTIGSWIFSREYLLKRLSSETAPLKKEWVKYWDKIPEQDIVYFMAIDPAISQEETADHTAIVIGGVNPNNDLYICERQKTRINPLQMIEDIFRLYVKWKPKLIGLETVAFQKVLKYWLYAECTKRGVSLPIKELTHSQRSKDERIMGLQPRMESGKFYIHPTMTDIEDEVVKYRLDTDGSDDLLDAIASLNELIYVPRGTPAEDPISKLPMLEQRVWKGVREREQRGNNYDETLGSDY